MDENSQKYCEFLLNQICFFSTELRPCCSKTIENSPLQFSIESENVDLQDIENYLELREKYINEFVNGTSFCYKNCALYEPVMLEKQKNSNFAFNYITISNRTYCNCDCIYCEQTYDSTREKINRFKPYNIVPILEKLREKNLISANCKFVISGGELAEYPSKELEYIFNLNREVGGSLLLLSSGIRYSNLIADVLKNHDTYLNISVDAGTRETYETVKRVKTFDTVWKNIEEYVKSAGKNDRAVVEVKYVVIPGINDYIEEAEQFIKKCLKVKCKYIKTEIEHFYMKDNIDKEMPERTKNVFKYFFKAAEKYHLKLMTDAVGREYVLRNINETRANVN